MSRDNSGRSNISHEKESLLPLCYGASLNVFPSRMAHEMSSGLKAYRLTSCEQARRVDLVEIFDQGHDVIPSTVEGQRAFYQAWLLSLRT